MAESGMVSPYDQCINRKCCSARAAQREGLLPEGWGQVKENDIATIRSSTAVATGVACVCKNCGTFGELQVVSARTRGERRREA